MRARAVHAEHQAQTARAVWPRMLERKARAARLVTQDLRDRVDPQVSRHNLWMIRGRWQRMVWWEQ